MRRIIFTALVALLPFTAHAYVEVGKATQEFKMKDIAGVQQSMQMHKGKIVVLEWHNPECPFVKKHYEGGTMQSLQSWAKEKGVVWIAVNSAAKGKQGHMTPEQAREMLTRTGSNVSSYIIDEKGGLGRLYDAKTTPHMFVVDKDGILVYAGAIDDKPSVDPKDIETAKPLVKDAITALLEGKKPEVATSTAYGCGVKY